jgi:aspartate/methionine/tyrosine aminotransferase
VILADEVYERLIFGDDPVARSFAKLGDKERVVVVNSFSKTYNMTGWRLGWVQASERTVRAMASGAEFITSNATSIAQRAGITALRDGDEYVARLRDHLTQRRDQVMTALGAMPGLSLVAPSGAFFAFARVEGLTDSASFAETLLRESGVAVTPGSAFGEGGEGHFRLCFAASEGTIAEALDRIGTYFARGRLD